jgi:hypothetical protein
MTLRFARTSAAALALSLIAAPALACPASIATDVAGDDNAIDIGARDCAQLGTYVRGYGHSLDGTVMGSGSRVVTGSLGGRTATHVDIRGLDNQVGTLARSDSRIDARAYGNGNEMALRAQNGTRISAQTTGNGNFVRVSTY